MRLLTAAGLLVLSAGPSLAAYVVELDAGDRMTVDSYWEDGERIHLMRGGIDLSVPRSRVRSLKAVSGSAEAGVRPTPAPAARAAADESPESRKDLEADQRRIDHHLLRLQQERSVARARGDDPKTIRRLDREFQRTQKRRMEVMRKVAGAPES
jgi:hypothetical protein